MMSNPKKWLLGLLIAGCSVSCSVRKNETGARAWLAQAEKPVVVRQTSRNGLTYNRRYTLVDRRGDVYFTREVRWLLPDTLGGGEGLEKP